MIDYLTNPKIGALEEIRQKLDSLPREKIIVQCHGVFDITHPNHIKHLKEAKAFGDVLVVSITDDAGVRAIRGPGKPIFNQHDRALTLAELECVDYVAICDNPRGIKAIQILQPNIYVKGIDYKNSVDTWLQKEKEYVESIGGIMKFTDSPIVSTTNIININHPGWIHSAESIEFLKSFRMKPNHNYTSMINLLNGFKDIKVCVIGESIMDQYVFLDTLHKAPKTNILANKCGGYIGGWGATATIANSIRNFAQCTLLTVDSQAPISKEFYIPLPALETAINCQLVAPVDKTSMPIVKKRYIEDVFPERAHREVLNEIVSIDYQSYDDNIRGMLHRFVMKELVEYDLVVIADFGHGMIDNCLAKDICINAKFLAMTVQANESNWGLNNIFKYPRADMIFMDDQELALAVQRQSISNDKMDQLTWLSRQLIAKGTFPIIILTMGSKGSFICQTGMEKSVDVVHIPALLQGEVVDRIGAGDCFMSLASLGGVKGYSTEIIGFLGNIAGWEGTQSLAGAGKYVTFASAEKYIKLLLG